MILFWTWFSYLPPGKRNTINLVKRFQVENNYLSNFLSDHDFFNSEIPMWSLDFGYCQVSKKISAKVRWHVWNPIHMIYSNDTLRIRSLAKKPYFFTGRNVNYKSVHEMMDIVQHFNKSILDTILQRTTDKFTVLMTKNETNRMKLAFDRLDKRLSIRTVFSVLWHSKMPCFDVKGC